jgi:glycosyltransferase involved in cell wall biosynthesis
LNGKKRIAIWTPGGVGGGFYSQGQPALMQVIESLAREFQVTVFSFHQPNPDFMAEGFTMVTVTKLPGPLRWWLLTFKFLVLFFRKPFTVLYACWGFPAGFIIVVLGKLLRVPTIVHLQGGEVACIPELRYGTFCNPIYKRLSLWSYRKASHVIVLTQFQKQLLLRAGVNRHIHIIPYGPDLNLFPFKEFDYTPDRELRCLHVANLTPIKDQATLIKAFALISARIPARLHIVGLDTMNGKLSQMCSRLGIDDRVEFFSPQSHKVIHRFYTWADIFILTSLYEGQGVVWAEAAASGVVLAGTSVGLLYDLGGAYGISVMPKDYQGLADKIIEVIRDEGKIRNMISLSLDWAKRHPLEWTVTEIVRVINSR